MRRPITGSPWAFALERPGRWRARCTISGQALVQPLDDIAAFPKRPQALFRIRRQNPARGPGRFSKPQPLERPHPTDPDLPQRIALRHHVRGEDRPPLPPFPLPGPTLDRAESSVRS